MWKPRKSNSLDWASELREKKSQLTKPPSNTLKNTWIMVAIIRDTMNKDQASNIKIQSSTCIIETLSP